MHSYGDIAEALDSKANTSRTPEDSPVVRRPIDAVLRKARLINGVLVGQVFADWRERFSDGTVVTTSRVTAQYHDVFYTSHSVYYVADWADA